MDRDFTNKDITHVKNKDLEYITFNILDKYKDKLTHAFFLKKGGRSEGIYSSLNVRLSSEDRKRNVLLNLNIIKNELNTKKLYKAAQAHTDKILTIDNLNKDEYEIEKINQQQFDAYITKEKNIATLITTADCNPIIIYDPIKNVVANIHSGWKGTVKQIYLKVAKKMHKEFDSNYEDMIVCIGPSINKCCFCSSELEFKNIFLKIWQNEEEYITTNENGQFFIDLTYIIKKDLVSLGLKNENIILSNICTVCNSDYCFSYRVSTKRKEKDYGVMATVTELK